MKFRLLSIMAAVAVLLGAFALAQPRLRAQAQTNSVTCGVGSYGSPTGFGAATACGANMVFLHVTASLWKGTLLDSKYVACIPLFCRGVSAFKYRNSSGGLFIVQGVHGAVPPPGYLPPAGTAYSVASFYAP